MSNVLAFHDFFIRHLRLNKMGLKCVDSAIPDIKCEVSGNAKNNLLKSYEPPKFCCKADNEIGEKKWNLQIVIPMYNSQKYVVSCINSIVGQKTKYTYKIIVIDDGSTDYSTPLIRAKYKNYPLEVIRQANRGTAVARNSGIAKIEADYVMFVDADDMLLDGAIDRLLDCAYAQNACIVEGGYECFDNGLRRKVSHSEGKSDEVCGSLWGFSWAKVIKAEMLGNICFPSGYWFEDTMISYLLYPKCKNAYTIKNTVYKYRRNKGGFSHIRGNDIRLLDSFWVLDKVLEEFRTLGIEVTPQIYDFILGSMVTSSRRLMYMNDEIRREVLEAFAELLNNEYSAFRSSRNDLAVFEKTVRNNDYSKYVKVVVWIRE